MGIAKPIYILGAGECYTHEHIFLMPSLTTTGAVESSRRAYAMARYGPRDLHTAGVYDCFTGTVIMMLEDLGFCPKGEGGAFAASGAALGILLRRNLPAAHDHQRNEPRYRMVLHAGFRVAGEEARVRTLAG